MANQQTRWWRGPRIDQALGGTRPHDISWARFAAGGCAPVLHPEVPIRNLREHEFDRDWPNFRTRLSLSSIARALNYIE